MYQRILVAVDGGKSSDLAIDQAIALAKVIAGAEVRALFVADDSDVFFDVSNMDPSQIMAEIIEFGQAALEAAATKLREAGVAATTRLAERPVSPGRISETIVAEAAQWQADVIVMGTHGRRGVRRLVMGSVSEGVISQATLPVLLVRAAS
jgi:nucleotide-binding universal stress UspA family protein